MKKLFSVFLTLCLAAGLCTSLTGCGKTKLYLYNCASYMDETILQEFEEQFNCEIKVSYYEAPEEMYTKLVNTGENYDVIITSDYMIQRMIAKDMLTPLNKDNLPLLSNSDAKYMDICSQFDPGNLYAVPYMWGTLGILYDTKKVTGPVDSWNVLWDESYAGSVSMIDSTRDAFAISLLRQNYSLNETDETAINKAFEDLIAQKKLTVRSYSMDQVKTDLCSGLATLGVVFSGDAITSMDSFSNLSYSLPKEGTNVFVDAAVIPASVQNKTLAEQFINFLCEGDIAFRNVEETGYCTPNRLAFEQLDDAVKNNALIYPDAEYLSKCEVYQDWGDKAEAYENLFLTVKNS